MTEMMALGIQQPQINTVANFNAAQSNAIDQKTAQIQQQQLVHQALAEHALGVMGGRLDGQVDPTALNDWTSTLEASGNPESVSLAQRLKANPGLVPVIAKGSLSVLQAGQDQARIELAQKQYELELANSQKPPAPPADIQEYNLYVEQAKAAGQAPLDYLSYQQALKGNGVSMTMPDGTVMQVGGAPSKGVNAFDTEEGKNLAKLSNDIYTNASNADAQLATLDKMAQLLNNDQVYTGAGGEQVAQLQKLAAAFGLDPNAVKDTEAFNALSKKAVLDAMGGSLGAGFSNADRQYVDEQQPTLTNSKEGNLQLIDILKKVAERKVQIADFMNQYRDEHGGRLDYKFQSALAKWAKENPLFPDPNANDTPGKYTGNEPGYGDSGGSYKPDEVKTINGKTYYRHGSDWYEGN